MLRYGKVAKALTAKLDNHGGKRNKNAVAEIKATAHNDWLLSLKADPDSAFAVVPAFVTVSMIVPAVPLAILVSPFPVIVMDLYVVLRFIFMLNFCAPASTFLITDDMG